MTGGNDSTNPNQPVAYDADGNPLYAAPQYPRDTVDNSTNSGPRSHVTSVPERHDGHNFDPRIRVQYANEPRVVHAARDFEPEELVVSEELKLKHQRSTELYPNLNLSSAEYVIMSIKRHPIGLLLPMMVTLITTMILFGFFVM